MTTKPKFTDRQQAVMEALRAGCRWTRDVHDGTAMIHETGEAVHERTIKSLADRGVIDRRPFAPILGNGGGLS